MNRVQDVLNEMEISDGFWIHLYPAPVVKGNSSNIGVVKPNRAYLFGDNYYNEELRAKYAVSLKPSKFFNLILPDLLPEAISHLASVFSAKYSQKTQYKFILSDDFERGYDQRNYLCSFRSCMWEDPVGDFYRAAGAKILLCESQCKDKLLAGRAVVWPDIVLGRDKNKVTFMDRVYSEHPVIEALFVEYAKSKGWAYLPEQCRDSRLVVWKDNIINANQITFEVSRDLLRFIRTEFIPYLDTIGELDLPSMMLGPIDDNDNEHGIRLKSTNGRYELGDEVIEVGDSFGYVIDDELYYEDTVVELDDMVRFKGCYYFQQECKIIDGVYIPKLFLEVAIVDKSWHTELVESRYTVSYKGLLYHVDCIKYTYAGDPIPKWIAREYKGKFYDPNDTIELNGELVPKIFVVLVEDQSYHIEDPRIIEFSENMYCLKSDTLIYNFWETEPSNIILVFKENYVWSDYLQIYIDKRYALETPVGLTIEFNKVSYDTLTYLNYKGFRAVKTSDPINAIFIHISDIKNPYHIQYGDTHTGMKGNMLEDPEITRYLSSLKWRTITSGDI